MLLRIVQLLLHFLRGSLLALGFVMLQLIAFFTCFLGSAFGAMVLAGGIHFFWNFELPTFAIVLLQGLFLISWAKMYSFYEDYLMGTQIERGNQRYPVFLGLVPVFVRMSLNLYGIYVIYAQFVRVHLYGDQNPYPGAMMDPSSIEDMESVVLLQKTVVLLSTRGRVAFWHFIIAFSYLIFTTTAVINVELKEQLKALSLTPPKIQEFATVTKTLFVIGQTCITVCYAIPLFYSYIVLNYMSPGFMDNGTSFFYLCIIAASLGFLGSFLESKKPFPQIKGRPPLFPFERNVQARILLLKYALLPSVYFSFFEHRPVGTSLGSPKSNPSQPSPEIDPHLLLFTILFSLLILHTMKILSISLFVPRIVERRRIQALRLQERQRELAEGQNLERAEAGEGARGNEAVPFPGGIVQIPIENGVELDPTFVEEQIGNGNQNPAVNSTSNNNNNPDGNNSGKNAEEGEEPAEKGKVDPSPSKLQVDSVDPGQENVAHSSRHMYPRDAVN